MDSSKRQFGKWLKTSGPSCQATRSHEACNGRPQLLNLWSTSRQLVPFCEQDDDDEDEDRVGQAESHTPVVPSPHLSDRIKSALKKAGLVCMKFAIWFLVVLFFCRPRRLKESIAQWIGGCLAQYCLIAMHRKRGWDTSIASDHVTLQGNPLHFFQASIQIFSVL